MPDVRNIVWLLGLALLAPTCAQAQVRINQAALRQLQGLPPLPPAPPPAPPSVRQVVAKPSFPPPARHSAHRQSEPPAANPSKPAPRPKPATPGPVSAPTPPTPTVHEPVVPPVARIDFAPNSATLPANAASLLKPFCASKSRIPVMARAPATPDNPGMAMQLSMERAFAIRAALISCGVPAQNIVPQSTGGVLGANNNEALIGVPIKP